MRRTRSAPALTTIALVTLALATLFASWAGCAAGSDTNATSITGTGGSGGSSGTMSGTGGASSSSSSGGGTGGMMTCAADEKACPDGCVKVDDPAYGCSLTGCDPCTGVPHAQAACAGGVCVIGSCDAGFKNCDGNDANGCEINVQNDPAQCGACGSPCVVPHASANCVMGVCGVATCDAGRLDCDGDPLNGCEAALDVDPKNCGGCGVACPPAETCEGGLCGLYCPKGKANCDNNEDNGCETPLNTLTDCAFCGDACAPANAQASCDMNGVCTLVQCNPGFANCDTSADNGCETNTNTDAGSCGTCGNVCPSGPHSTAVCQNGGCKLNCDPGWADCDGNPNNGCEIHVDVDTANCGSCGHGCAIANGTAACMAGTCQIAQCNAGFADCNTSPTDGCEINTQTNPQNCGTCGHGCSISNGTAACSAGMCAVGSCNSGYQDCDGLVSNGCEVNTASDPNHCGSCTTVCNLANATAGCSNSQCTVAACNTGYANCNNAPGDGCEVNTNTDPVNCGFCTHQCFVANGVAGCGAGQCTVASCNTGWGDCNGLSQDGCEINTTNDVNNCGGCGQSCSTSCAGNVAATSCAGSACSITACTSGWSNVDGVCTNGCECPLSTTPTTCGGAANLGSLQPGQSITPFSSSLIPAFVGATPNVAWFSVTFNGNGNTAYHPKVTLTSANNEFVMDVQTDCAGTIISSCTDNGANGSKGVKNWEASYTGPSPAADPTSKDINGVSNFQPINIPTTLYIKVYRVNPNANVTCSSYTLTASD